MPGKLPANFDAARRALGVAKSVDDVKKVLVIADGLLAAARRASDKKAEIDFAELRIRAMRRLGQMMDDQKRTRGLSKGGRPAKTGSKSDPVSKPVSLAEAGIDKHLADNARKWASMSEEEFEAIVVGWRKRIEKAKKRVTVTLTRPERAIRAKQLPLFDPSQSYLSWNGRKLERVRINNSYAPDWMKLTETSDSMIALIATTVRRLNKLATGLGEPSAIENLKKEFERLESSIADLADQYWWIRKFLAGLGSSGAAMQSQPKQEYDPELERRGLWPPDANEDHHEDLPF